MAKRLTDIEKSVRTVLDEVRRSLPRGVKPGPTDVIRGVCAAGRGCAERETSQINWVGIVMFDCWNRGSAGSAIAAWSSERIARAVSDLAAELDGMTRADAANTIDRYAIRMM